MIIAESIGFSATHSITDILSDLPGLEVSHGSRDFVSKAALGQSAQSIDDFLASMKASQDAGRLPVAIHTLFPPTEMKPACDALGCDYWLLVREPQAQINSCFAWISRAVLGGQSAEFLAVIKYSLERLNTMQVQITLPNILYVYAMNHVLTFNFLALGLGAKTHKMEVLLSDEAAFRDAFRIAPEVRIPHFEGKTVHEASHTGQKEFEALADPDRELINQGYALSLGNRDYRLSDMKLLLGY